MMGTRNTIRNLMNPSNIIEGMAEILWAMAWADHVEEHGCAGNISGCEITEIMPPVPGTIYALAERYMGRIEQANNSSEPVLFCAALQADGIEPYKLQCENPGKFHRLESRFGNYLAHMVSGSGVSWFDDHNKFNIIVPNCDYGKCRMIADEDCDEEEDDE